MFVQTGKRSNNGRQPARSFADSLALRCNFVPSSQDYHSSFPLCRASSKVQQLGARSVNRMQLVPAKA